MKTKYLVAFSIISLLAIILAGVALAEDTEMGTAFTYQGFLKYLTNPADVPHDFEFRLFDELTDGIQVGSTVTLDNVEVNNGLFNVELDFGSDVFNGNARWLDISVRIGTSTGDYTQLTPRQPLTPTPYALYSQSAPWSGLTGVPTGFADSIDGVEYENMVIVAKSGGDFTSIQASLDSIADASTDNRFLVWVAPGIYTETVTMKQFVDIEGSGELSTKITYTGSYSSDTGTVVGEDNAELRFLTVENTGDGNNLSIAIYNYGASPRLTHVTANAIGDYNNMGVANYNSSSPTMTNVTATASGGTNHYGVYNYNSSSPTMTNVTATTSGGGDNYGVYNYNSSSPTMTNVTATASGGTDYNFGVVNITSSSPTMINVTATASGGTRSFGVRNENSSPTMTNVTATASGGVTDNWGVWNKYLSPTMTNVTATASGGTNNHGVHNSSSSPTINNSVIEGSGGTNNYGIYNWGGTGTDNTLKVNNSQIIGSTATIYSDTEEFTTYVGASLLAGGSVDPNGGEVICAGVYDETYIFFASSCP